MHEFIAKHQDKIAHAYKAFTHSDQILTSVIQNPALIPAVVNADGQVAAYVYLFTLKLSAPLRSIPGKRSQSNRSLRT